MRPELERCIEIFISEQGVMRRDIGQACLGAEGHRLPVVRAKCARHRRIGGIVITRLGILDRAPGLEIVSARPVHIDKVLCRNQLAGGPVDDEEETVLGCLHQHLARLAVNRESGEGDGLGCRIIPAFARRFLIMPQIFTRVRVQRHDGRQEEVVALTGAADLVIPGAAIADPDIELIQVLIVNDRIPYGSAAAGLPIFAKPGPAGQFGNGLVRSGPVRAVRRIARHGVEAPDLIAGFGIIGGDIAARAQFRAAIANQHLALHHAWCAGDGGGSRLIDRDHGPHRLAGLDVQRDQPPVERPDIELSIVQRRTTIADVAAPLGAEFAGHFGVVTPDQLSAHRVQGKDLGPGGRYIDDPVLFQRGAFLRAIGVEFMGPGQAELADGGFVDLVKSAEALFVEGAAIGDPVARLIAGRKQRIPFRVRLVSRLRAGRQ